MKNLSKNIQAIILLYKINKKENIYSLILYLYEIKIT